MRDSELRKKVMNAVTGEIIKYNNHYYRKITSTLIEDMKTGDQLMMGIDF